MVQAVRELDRYSKSEIEECSELLQYIYVNDDECFVRVLNSISNKLIKRPNEVKTSN